jgi:ABC-type transport system substrate-binding protein
MPSRSPRSNPDDRAARVREEGGLEEFDRKPVGTAFKLREWKDVRVVLDANDAYWKGKPKVRTLAFKPIPEDAARIAALQRGEVDIIDAVPYDRIREIESGPNLRISQRQGEQIYIGLDTLRVDPFKKREVRQALNYAVNADGIVKSLLLGYGVRLNGPFFPVTPGYDAHLKPYAYDPDRAKRMLAQAGYPNGFEVEFALSPGLQGIAKGQEVGEAIAGQLARVGVRTKIAIHESAAMFSNYAAKKFQMYMFPWKSGRSPAVISNAAALQDPRLLLSEPRRRSAARRLLLGARREEAPGHRPELLVFLREDARGSSSTAAGSLRREEGRELGGEAGLPDAHADVAAAEAESP